MAVFSVLNGTGIEGRRRPVRHFLVDRILAAFRAVRTSIRPPAPSASSAEGRWPSPASA